MPSLGLTCIETRTPDKAAAAIERTLHCVGVDEIYWIGTAAFPRRFQGVEVTNVLIADFQDFAADINRLHFHLLPKTVRTDFNLVVQADGFAVNREAWSDRFWSCDYI